MRSELDPAAVRLHVGPHALECRLHALGERHRVQAVDQQQAADEAVARERVTDLGGRLERPEDPLQALAVQPEDRRHQLLGRPARLDVGDRLEARSQLLEALDRLRYGHQQSPVGVCTTFLTWPLPRYMCTPQGRQGSKLRTARMMSMPLKFSGPFSSKIGVFCTASSYGPGVP